MALYRDNSLEFQGINASRGIPNLQRHQIGRALDYTDLDENGHPNVVYSFNRNIHEKDLATKTHYVKPVHQTPVSSAEILRLSAKEHYTQAYKDGLEYIKAEKDYRAKERYLDSITPSRRSHTVTVGTSTSTSGLPVPDTEGRVFHYDAQTTAQTGMMFEAPANVPEVPDLPRNVNGKPVHPVILTREKEIVIDNNTGAAQVKVGSSSVLKAPVISNPLGYTEPQMPGAFPNMIGSDKVHIGNATAPEITIDTSRSEKKPEIALTTVRDPVQVEETILNAEVSNPFVRVSGKTPYGNVRKNRFEPYKRKFGSRAENALKHTVINNGQEIVGRSIGDTMQFELMDNVDIRKRLEAVGRVEVSRPKATIGNKTDELTWNPSVKRKGEISLRKEPTSKRRKIDDADEIQLVDPRLIERNRSHRRIDAQLNAETAVDSVGGMVKKEVKASMLRPIAALRGQPVVDFAIPPTFSITDVEPTTSIRTRPRKSQKMETRPTKKPRLH